jgi:hypothetical protein
VRFATVPIFGGSQFRNEHLLVAFTVLMVTCSEDPYFGACAIRSTEMAESPGLPHTQGLTYNATSLHAGVTRGQPALLGYAHDGTDAARSSSTGYGAALPGERNTHAWTSMAAATSPSPSGRATPITRANVAEVDRLRSCLGEEERAGLSSTWRKSIGYEPSSFGNGSRPRRRSQLLLSV